MVVNEQRKLKVMEAESQPSDAIMMIVETEGVGEMEVVTVIEVDGEEIEVAAGEIAVGVLTMMVLEAEVMVAQVTGGMLHLVGNVIIARSQHIVHNGNFLDHHREKYN